MNLSFLLFPSVNRCFVLIESFIREGNLIICLKVKLSSPFDNRRWLKRGPNQMTTESTSRGSIKDSFVVGQPVFTIGGEFRELGDLYGRVFTGRDIRWAHNL